MNRKIEMPIPRQEIGMFLPPEIQPLWEQFFSPNFQDCWLLPTSAQDVPMYGIKALSKYFVQQIVGNSAGYTGPGKALVLAEVACWWPLQGPPGYWLLVCATWWDRRRPATIRRKQWRQEDVDQKVVGSNPGSGKEIFHLKIFFTLETLFSTLLLFFTSEM